MPRNCCGVRGTVAETFPLEHVSSHHGSLCPEEIEGRTERGSKGRWFTRQKSSALATGKAGKHRILPILIDSLCRGAPAIEQGKAETCLLYTSIVSCPGKSAFQDGASMSGYIPGIPGFGDHCFSGTAGCKAMRRLWLFAWESLPFKTG